MAPQVETLGIDVSVAQGIINWGRVHAWRGPAGEQVEFAIAKASEGNGWPDAQFQMNWAGIRTIDRVRGAYHFGHPDDVHERDAADEAKRFVDRMLDFRPGVDFAALDIEEASKIHSGAPFTDWVLTFQETTESLTKQIPFLYTGKYFFDEHDGDPSPEVVARIARYPLWLAAYVVNPDAFLPTDWRGVGWVLRQRSGDVAAPGDTILHVDGIGAGKANVDRNIYRGTIDQLKAFIATLVTETPREPVQLGDGGPANDPYYVDRAEAQAEDDDDEPDTAPQIPRAITGRRRAIDVSSDPDKTKDDRNPPSS